MFGSPIQGALNRVTQGWGLPREHRDGVHEGYDFPVPIGTSVHAVDSGTVVTSVDSDDPGGAGKMISIQHDNGIISRYMHLDQRLVSKGDKVVKGQLIARSGASGIKQSAAHLHFDLKVKPELLAKVWRWAAPLGGFPPERYGTIGIPSEPFIPTTLSPAMKVNATKYGLPVLGASAGMGLFGLLAFGFGGYWLWKKYVK
jgi:murein DD-endopeptidase MepM/ murein hydrolase activator NlpD